MEAILIKGKQDLETINELKMKQIQADSADKICASCYLIECCCEADRRQKIEEDIKERLRIERNKTKNKYCSRCGEYDADIKKKAKMNNQIIFCKKCIDRTNKRFDDDANKYYNAE